MRSAWLKRVVLFVVANAAVLLMLLLVTRLLGLDSYLQQQGVALDYRALLVFAAVFGFAGSFISLALSKWMALRFTGARPIERPQSEEEQWLKDTVARLARKTGIGMPTVAIYRAAEPNAFATGARRDHSLVAVSSGLLQLMDREQIEAVLGHEMSHVANGDMVTMSLLQGVVNTFVVFVSRLVGFVVDRVVFRTERGYGPGYWITVIVAQLVLGLLATVIVMAFSRRREYRADAGSAEINGAAPMVRALEKLRLAHGPTVLPGSMRAFGIRDREAGGLARLFMSHPPLDERIARLKQRQPGRTGSLVPRRT